MHLLLRLCRLRDAAAAQGGGLLRVLFVRVGSLSPGTSQSIVLRHAGQPMSGDVDCTTGRADWARDIRGCLIWGIPIAILLMSYGTGPFFLVLACDASLRATAFFGSVI